MSGSTIDSSKIIGYAVSLPQIQASKAGFTAVLLPQLQASKVSAGMVLLPQLQCSKAVAYAVLLVPPDAAIPIKPLMDTYSLRPDDLIDDDVDAIVKLCYYARRARRDLSAPPAAMPPTPPPPVPPLPTFRVMADTDTFVVPSGRKV